ncbi:regulator of telomere elongation helicase 1 homolog [Microplitis demolitor]|uniref:regulator of telomere elongation helicase 1 homolog n=1 Tax=Microplitis demolitor TaxID=69319 RepID=UPI0004400393|nr:regulator of telomere elongation helicase 1 homolog [Microplitis demolitor]
MPEIKINNIVVNFPFEPYDVQKTYMSKVIECLQNKKHGVLESPTGTGKTLCLLCSSLSWLMTKKAHLQAQMLVGAVENPEFGGKFFEKLKKDLEMASGGGSADGEGSEGGGGGGVGKGQGFGWSQPKIIYASRTHSQLTQVMGELKRTSFKHLKVAVIGSRDQLCIHPEISKESNSADKIHLCQAKVRTRSCMYYNNVENRKEEAIFKDTICDIEDLVKAGTKFKCCPYFMAKELKQSADITFMPYNYLLDAKTRRSQAIDLQNHIILLDEAHNVEKTCEESASLQISSTDIALCIDEISSVMKRLLEEEESPEIGFDNDKEAQKDFTADDLCLLKSIFLALESAIDALVIKEPNGDTYPGSFIFELLESAELTSKELQVAEKLDKIVLWLSTTSTSPFARAGRALQKFSDFIRTVFTSSSSSMSRHRERIRECYKIFITPEPTKSKKDGWNATKPVNQSAKLISYWCFSPGFGMRQLLELGVHSIILTSGTLSPLKPFISELGIPIDVQLENPHIVATKQISIGVLGQGPDGHPLNSSFNTRNDPKYISSLGRTIFNFSCLIPHGLLVFFPSYPIMKKCCDDWQQTGLWSTICAKKPVFVEPQGKDTFNAIINDYYAKIRDPAARGAIFLAVCRGKVSEGLDFSDNYGRAVLVTGLPYPPMMDPRVLLKQKYLDEVRVKNKGGLTGAQWYQLEASRAVNQAVGRIIRHIGDFGAIILCDCRFNGAQFKEHLSKWLKPYVKNYSNFGMVTRELRDFFKNVGVCVRNEREISTVDRLPTVGRLPVVGTSGVGTAAKVGRSKGEVREENVDLKAYKSEGVDKSDKGTINFVTSKVKGNWSGRSWEATKEEGDSVAKKRKLKIQKFEVNYLEADNSDGKIESAVGKTDFSGGKGNFGGESGGRGESGGSGGHAEAGSVVKKEKFENLAGNSNGKVEKNDDKKSIGQKYLKSVKKSLTKENFQIFAKIIESYRARGNFDELCKTLEKLFLECGEEKQDLFVGFKTFLKKQHIEEFDNYCKRL